MNMSKTAAIKAARQAVGQPCGRGTSWQIYGPYYSTAEGLRGPTTSINADSYWSARAKRSHWVASLSLCLMGWDPDDAECATYGVTGSITEIVDAALRGR